MSGAHDIFFHSQSKSVSYQTNQANRYYRLNAKQRLPQTTAAAVHPVSEATSLQGRTNSVCWVLSGPVVQCKHNTWNTIHQCPHARSHNLLPRPAASVVL